MASLANQTISSTYDGLIKTSTDQPVGVSGVQLLEDGVGNTLALSVGRANQGVTVTGTLTATSLSGTIAAASVLADGVTATTQSSGDNSTKVATTAYVDAQVTASDLDFAGDSGTGAVDLDSQSLTIAGTANEIETSASGQTITIGLPSSVTVGTLTATTLAGTLSTAAQTNITSVGTLSSLAVSGDLTVDTNTLYVDSANNNVGIGTTSLSSATWNKFLQIEATFPGIVYNSTQGGSPFKFSTGVDDNVYTFRDETNSATRMVIDSSGNVGIGTSSPSSILHLKEDSGQARLLIEAPSGQNSFVGFQNTGGTQPAFLIGYNATDSAFVFYDDIANTERMRINASGNVGIGTSSPSTKLDVRGTISALSSGVDGTYQPIFNALYSGNTAFYSQIQSSMSINGFASGFRFLGGGNNNISGTGGLEKMLDLTRSQTIFYTEDTERMRIDSSGTTTMIKSSEGSATIPLVLRNSGSTTVGTETKLYLSTVSNDNRGSYISSIITSGSNDNALILATNSSGSDATERMRITSGGDVCINNTSTINVSKQTINAGVANNGLHIEVAGGLNAYTGIGINRSNGNGTAISFERANTGVGSIYLNTNSTSFNTSSDYRLKENVVPMEGALDRVDALKPSRFNFITDPEKTVDGFLAHEVAEVIPEAISGEKDAVDEEGNPVYQSIDHSKVVPLLTAAIQELSAKVAALESKLNG